MTDSARLRLVPPPDAESTEQTIGAAESTADADADTLRQRIRELENQLADNERLIELRDQELQELQQRLADLQAGEVEAPPSELQSELIDEVPPADLVDEVPADDAAAIEGDVAEIARRAGSARPPCRSARRGPREAR